MTVQNLPIPSSYTQSLMARYRASRERLNSGAVEDLGIRCVSASVRASEWHNPATIAAPPIPEREPFDIDEWARQQQERFDLRPLWFTLDLSADPEFRKRPKIALIQSVVAQRCNIDLQEMFSRRRLHQVAFARQIAMYLAKTMTLHSLPEIGRRFGGKDHTTVLHAVRKITAMIKKDATLAAHIAELMADIEKEIE